MDVERISQGSSKESGVLVVERRDHPLLPRQRLPEMECDLIGQLWHCATVDKRRGVDIVSQL